VKGGEREASNLPPDRPVATTQDEFRSNPISSSQDHPSSPPFGSISKLLALVACMQHFVRI